ncbi:hypothetical protein BMF94_6601 [Rhodotorula taiwanensis]|uniref:Transcription factor CBF/NF-Y/archaeal histone domain-containing protein n=1 Tax=Rhodotorula taiwanensis TaxID=741276 RepID=A0A2S5B0X3_9BASI|nr:hypothetical protein BMF94_6601 [Rhodotorula taiwanensis]
MGKKSNQARFPLARIKKMIQQDEDVGKVAQATPIVSFSAAKALELFLGSLVAACVKDAEGRGSHKISPYGLKRAVNATPMLDFCADIVEAIPDPLEGEEDDDEPPKRKRATAGKKRAAASSDAQDGASDGAAKKVKAAPRKQRAASSKKAKKGGDDDDSDDFIDDDESESDADAARSSSKAPKYDDDDDYEEA